MSISGNNIWQRFGSTLSLAVLLAACVYVVRLFINGTITLYIHPRYRIFSVIMAACGLVMLALYVVSLVRERRNATEQLPNFGLPEIVFIVLLVVAFVLPARTLSSDTLNKRSARTPTISTAAQMQGACPDTQPHSIPTWVGTLSFANSQCFDSKPISVTGYVINPTDGSLPSNYFYVAKTVISCCVVDARPYALPVMATDQLKAPATNTWIKLSGTLHARQLNGQAAIIIQPNSIEPTTPSSEPYDYYTGTQLKTQSTLQQL